MLGTIAVIPVGSVSRSFCRELGQQVSAIIDRPVELLASLGEPKYAYNPAREQYHSTAIVRRVGQAINPKKHSMGLGIVDVDLFMPELNFVFGDADREHRAGVVSTARMLPSYYGRPPDHEATFRRMTSEALHEIGHIARLPHCTHDVCAMFFANTLSDTDRKRASFCDTCLNRLAGTKK